MKWIVNDPNGYATSLRNFEGSNLTLTNSGATDVYYDVEAVAGTLNGSAPGSIPSGTKIANGGGTVQFFIAPKDLWVRSATQTVLDLQAIAPASIPPQPMTVLAGLNPHGNSPTKATITTGPPIDRPRPITQMQKKNAMQLSQPLDFPPEKVKV